MARLRPTALDLGMAAAVLAAAAAEALLTDPGAPVAAKVVAAGFAGVPLAWRTTAPVAATAATTFGFALAAALGLSTEGPIIPALAPLVAAYSVAALADARAVATAGLVALCGYVAANAAGPDGSAEDVAITTGFLAVALAVGRAVRLLGFETDVLEARAAELERERDVAVQQERARIARELHDVIGHSISVMGIQAGAVRRVLAPEQEHERAMLLGVERSGRDAVAEMRRLLGFLREDANGGPEGAPPTLGRLDELVASMRRAGMDIDLEVEGDLRGLPPGRELAAFRIVQEALTNALKHAPDSHVRARIARTPEELRIEVVDDGTRRGGGEPGHGLVGMRERVALYGGTLEAGRLGDSGFRVAATLPAERS